MLWPQTLHDPPLVAWLAVVFATGLGLAVWKGVRGIGFSFLFGFICPAVLYGTIFARDSISIGLDEMEIGAVMIPLLAIFIIGLSWISGLVGGLIGLLVHESVR